MTFEDLLRRLDGRCARAVLCGTAAQTWDRVTAGEHPDALMGQVLATLGQWCARGRLQEPVERSAAVNALGPLRLQYMADDGAPEGLRLVDQVVQAIDAAFDDEVLDRAARRDA